MIAEQLVDKFGKSPPSALADFEEEFNAFIAQLRIPFNHRRVTRATNLLERLFAEVRRYLEIIPNAWVERPVRKLTFGAMMLASKLCKSTKADGFETHERKIGKLMSAEIHACAA